MQWILLVTTWHLFPLAAFFIYRKPKFERKLSREAPEEFSGSQEKAKGKYTSFLLVAGMSENEVDAEGNKESGRTDWVPGDIPKPLNQHEANSPPGLANTQESLLCLKPFWVGFLLPYKTCSWSLAFLLFSWRFLKNKMMGKLRRRAGRATLEFSYDGGKFPTRTLASNLWAWHFIPTVPRNKSQLSGPYPVLWPEAPGQAPELEA